MTKCPTCGASAANLKNCEYCGSYLIQYANAGISAPSIGGDFVFPGLLEALNKHLSHQTSDSNSMPILDIEVEGPPSEMGKICTMMQIVDNEIAFDNVDQEGLAVFIPFEYGGPAYRKFFSTSYKELFLVKDGESEGFKDCYLDFGKDTKGAAAFISQLIVDFYEYDKSRTLKFDMFDIKKSDALSESEISDEDALELLKKIGNWIGFIVLFYLAVKLFG